MAKKEKEEKTKTEKDLEQLKKEIAQKGKEIEQLKKTIEEIRTQIQGKEETSKSTELGKIFEDVSKLLDVSFSILGTSGKVKGEKGKGLIGLINNLAALAEKSETYQKRVNLGKRGIVEFRVSSRPIKGYHTTKPTDRLKISKPKNKTSPTRIPMPPTATSIEEREPIVDVFEEEDYLNVMAELPGIEENDVNLKIENNLLTISAETPARKYYKEVKLPMSVEKDSVKYKYRNGILEVKLGKVKKTEKD